MGGHSVLHTAVLLGSLNLLFPGEVGLGFPALGETSHGSEVAEQAPAVGVA